LVGIIEIKLEHRRHLHKPLHIFATQPENSDATFSKEVLDEKREQVCRMFLVQDDPDGMKCKITDMKISRVFVTEECLNGC
jgi:hypothetical protein